LLLSVGNSVLASDKSSSAQANFVVEESVNNGVTMYTVSGNGAKEDAVKYLNNYQLQKINNQLQKENKQLDNGIMGISWNCTLPYVETGYGSNTDARNTTQVGFCTGVDLLTFPFETRYASAELGSQQAYWAGSTPYRADKIILNQSTKFTGLSITVSVPPGGSVTSDTASWKSDPILNEYSVNVDRPRVEAKTSNLTGGFITECEVIDISDIYIGTNIYRPQSVIEYP
jgi:hypothetical protein